MAKAVPSIRADQVGSQQRPPGLQRAREQCRAGEIDETALRAVADRFLLAYDSSPAGGFEPLRFIPKSVAAVLGLVTSKYPDVESQDLVLGKIEEASKYCPVEQLAISPQCGFGGSAESNFMTADEQFRKLENMVQVAERGWR